AVLDSELGELWKRVERLVDRPPLVHVDPQRQLRDRANRTDALDIEPVGAAELQLATAEPSGGLLRSARHAIGITGPDRPRRRRATARQREQPSCRHAEQLALEVVRRGVER